MSLLARIALSRGGRRPCRRFARRSSSSSLNSCISAGSFSSKSLLASVPFESRVDLSTIEEYSFDSINGLIHGSALSIRGDNDLVVGPRNGAEDFDAADYASDQRRKGRYRQPQGVHLIRQVQLQTLYPNAGT